MVFLKAYFISEVLYIFIEEMERSSSFSAISLRLLLIETNTWCSFHSSYLQSLSSAQVAPDLVVDLDTATTNYNKGTTITKRDEETTTNLSVRLATGSSTEEAVHENVGENIEEASETHPRELVHEIEKEIVIAVADNQESLMECEKQEHTSLESASESEVKEDLKLGQEVSPETETSPVKGSPHEEIPNDDRKIREDEERPNLVFDKHIAVESITSAERTTINDEREHTESKVCINYYN